MKKQRLILLLCLTVMLPCLRGGNDRPNTFDKPERPAIPVGLDAYRMWEMWPVQRLGVRSYMRSTYDRAGRNSDASNYLFADEEDYNVTLDVKGRGILYFFRANFWHGSPWHFVVDGSDLIVQEKGTDVPNEARGLFEDGEFIPSATFPKPLNWNWGSTKGADLIWTPMPFSESLRIAYSRTFYGTGYYIYHLFSDEGNLSRPIRPFVLSQVPDQDVIDLIGRSGTDIAPKDISTQKGSKNLDKAETGTLLLSHIEEAPSVVRAIKLTLPLDSALDLERLHLQVTWDGAETPSIDAPLCLFFGAGTLYNREKQEYLVKGFPVNIRYDYPGEKVVLACYFPMPFFRSARFELSGIEPGNAEIDYEIRYEPWLVDKRFSSYFHATYKDIPQPQPGEDLVWLDTEGMEGQKEWSGHFVGTSFIFSHDGILETLEGDPRFFFDDSQTPQAQGTGTEEWGGGGNYWRSGMNMTLPFVGHPCGARDKESAVHEKDLIESGYRFLLADLMPFGKRAVIRFEHGGENLSTEHYESVAYWYGLPSPSLVRTDEVDIGNSQSEKDHGYYSQDASAVETISSRYEWGMDFIPHIWAELRKTDKPWYKDMIGDEIYPAHEESGRHTRGESEFTIKLDPDNVGALLRRTLDYSFPNQTAEVFIADIDKNSRSENRKKADQILLWEKVGVWYLAGSNTYLYSFPQGELEKRELWTKTSNRRFRDDEFLIPANLTRGKKAVKVRIIFIPDDQKLFPDFPFPKKSAWSELRYKIYSIVIPRI